MKISALRLIVTRSQNTEGDIYKINLPKSRCYGSSKWRTYISWLAISLT
ncbi:MAG: hypothetical protein KME57_22600 [Scytonema hyalinum WJT4-NPBG1]|nr:hypothetical protein [Scytonema hyalinum WJT4-NPBG1]